MPQIKRVYTVDFEVPTSDWSTEPRRESWTSGGARIANPMTRYPRYEEVRSEWTPSFEEFGVVVEAEDGTIGFATGTNGMPVASLIDRYLGDRIEGEDAMAIEKIHDMLYRLCTPFGVSGLASYAISAIDLALWDLKGRILDVPVYELIGGPARSQIPCYATGGDPDWYTELGFEGVKLPCPYGPSDGNDGLTKNVELVRETRETVGDDVDLMLDCWMALDENYTVRLAEQLHEYDLRWIEEPLLPAHLAAHGAIRNRLPNLTIATGEHWHTANIFQQAVDERLVDIFQPDIRWTGGLTTLRKICDIAESAGIPVIPHAGGNTPFGQHACFALPQIPMAEYFIMSPPGIPLQETERLPGHQAPEDGELTLPEGPGFGTDLSQIEFSDRFLS